MLWYFSNCTPYSPFYWGTTLIVIILFYLFVFVFGFIIASTVVSWIGASYELSSGWIGFLKFVGGVIGGGAAVVQIHNMYYPKLSKSRHPQKIDDMQPHLREVGHNISRSIGTGDISPDRLLQFATTKSPPVKRVIEKLISGDYISDNEINIISSSEELSREFFLALSELEAMVS